MNKLLKKKKATFANIFLRDPSPCYQRQNRIKLHLVLIWWSWLFSSNLDICTLYVFQDIRCDPVNKKKKFVLHILFFTTTNLYLHRSNKRYNGMFGGIVNWNHGYVCQTINRCNINDAASFEALVFTHTLYSDHSTFDNCSLCLCIVFMVYCQIKLSRFTPCQMKYW